MTASFRFVLVALLLTAWPGKTWAAAPVQRQNYAACKEAFANERYRQSAALCGQYLAHADKDSAKYEAARYYLAASLEKLGFFHAAVEHYYQVANTRRVPELLPRALTALERIQLEHPIDEDMVLRDLIGDTDFGALPDDLADYVAYWQALTNMRRGLDEWANERFARINRHGHYFYRALYAASVRLLRDPREGNQALNASEVAAAKQFAVEAFAELFGALDLGAALESVRRRGEGDSKLALALKALLDEDNQVVIRLQQLPQDWEVELALLGFARVAAETQVLLERAREKDEDELGRPFAYQVDIGGIPIYRRSPPLEDRAKMIKSVASRYRAVRRTRGEALHSLARLLYEQKRFNAAYDTLGSVPKGTELSSELLLERAWSKYKAGDPHRAMGLLYALDAPVYRALFAPEKYVLRGLIYRRFCHFRAAKVAARRFRVQYGSALTAIREGRPLAEIRSVRDPALRRGEARRLYRFGRTLRNELARLGGFRRDFAGGQLLQRLEGIYRRKLEQVRAELAQALESSAHEVAEAMLDAEEQVHLLEYELGQAIFERVTETEGVATLQRRAPAVPIASSRVYYRFAGEYWTDELPSYRFNIENRCVE